MMIRMSDDDVIHSGYIQLNYDTFLKNQRNQFQTQSHIGHELERPTTDSFAPPINVTAVNMLVGLKSLAFVQNAKYVCVCDDPLLV
jgi:hypothetical protein